MMGQMIRIESSQYCRSTLLTLMTAVSSVNVVLPSRMMSYLLELGPLATLIPVNDIQSLQDLGLESSYHDVLCWYWHRLPADLPSPEHSPALWLPGSEGCHEMGCYSHPSSGGGRGGSLHNGKISSYPGMRLDSIR